MSFYKRYEIARLIHDGDVQTFSGTQVSTRRSIYLHLFGDVTLHPALGRLMQDVKLAEGAGRVIEVGEFGGGHYVVTDPIEGFTSLLDYLGVNPSVAAPPPPPPPPSEAVPRLRVPPAPPSEARPAPFVRAWRKPDPPVAPPPAAPSPPNELPQGADSGEEFTRQFHSRQSPQPSVQPGPQAGGEPGEFTQLFGSEKAQPRVAPAPRAKDAADEFTNLFGGSATAAPPQPAAHKPPAETDEFERLFQKPAAPTTDNSTFGGMPEAPQAPPPSPAPPPPPRPSALPPKPPLPALSGSHESGEFTRFFGRSLPGEHMNVEEEQAKNAALSEEPHVIPFRQASEFTRVFGPPPGSPGKAAPPPAPVSEQASRVSGLFDTSPDLRLPTDRAESPVAADNAEPDDYSKMIGASPQPEPPAVAPPPPQPAIAAPPAPQGTSRTKVILLIVCGFAGMVLAALMVYLLIARR